MCQPVAACPTAPTNFYLHNERNRPQGFRTMVNVLHTALKNRDISVVIPSQRSR